MTLFKAAKASDLIRRKRWDKSKYLYYTQNLGFCCMIHFETITDDVSDRSVQMDAAVMVPFELFKDDLFANDWEIYERVNKVQSDHDREADAGHSKLCDRVLEPPRSRRQDY